MFVKAKTYYSTTTKTRHISYKLCDSYRVGEKVRHHDIMYLGRLEELQMTNAQESTVLVKQLGTRLESLIRGGAELELLNPTIDPLIERLAQTFYKQYLSGLSNEKDSSPSAGNTSIQQEQSNTQDLGTTRVYLDSLEFGDCRDVGAEWLCLQALRQLDLSSYLRLIGWSDAEISLAHIHIISRAVSPGSELRTLRWIKDNSAVAELLGVDPRAITKDQLYKTSLNLLECKDGLDNYLSTKTNTLFDLKDNVLLFDLSNSYFEGKKNGSELAQYGRSKEKRTDAKLIVWASVVNCEGFLKHSHFYEGNKSNCKALVDSVNSISSATSATNRKPTLVIDAGISTKENLKLLSDEGYNYVCVSRARLKEYTIAPDCKPVIVFDNRQNKITLQRVKTNLDDDYIMVLSEGKQAKENSMQTKACRRFETELCNVQASINKKGGVKKYDKVLQRIGRLQEKYSSVQQCYKIEVVAENMDKGKKGKKRENVKSDSAGTTESSNLDVGKLFAKEIKWSKNTERKELGKYFIQTNLDEKNEADVWAIYNAIREIESVFRCLKTDLQIRPIHHRTDESVKAHLNLALLAYQIVSIVRHQLKSKKMNQSWSEIVRTMSSQKIVTVTIEDHSHQKIRVRKASIPEKKNKEIYDALEYKSTPPIMKRTKICSPPE